MERLLVDLLVVLLASRVAAEVAERARQPAVLGEILAGVAIGPAALGLVHDGEVLEIFGEIGVILLLFEVGRQMDLRDLGRVGGASLRVAAIGVVAPMALGYGVMLAHGVEAPVAQFHARGITATSVGITARVFGDLRLLASASARTVLGAAVADDVLGLLVLTVVVRAAAGGLVVQEVPNGGDPRAELPIAFFGPDRAVVTEGSDRGQSIEFIRAANGAVNWIRVTGRIAVRAR